MIYRLRIVAMLLTILLCSVGCRFRPTNNLVTNPAAPGLFSNWTGFGNARVAPPATYSYQVPAGTQPYYTPSNAAGSPTAPEAIGSGTITGTSDWRQPNAANPASFYGNAPAASSTTINQASFPTTAPDYRTTIVDERMDPTRMPASDATMVRAPNGFTPSNNWQMLNPGATQMPIGVPGSYEYRSTPQISGQNLAMAPSALPPLGNPVGYSAYPYSTQPPPVVLAQASTSPELLARDPNYQAGWRDRYTTGATVNR